MNKRKSISKKTRFEIFKRDEFTCQYCGSHPPKCILHIDHITPVKNGGDNSMDNLITSCSVCNSGKAANCLDVVPESLSIKAEKIKESEMQIREYNKIMIGKRKRIEDEMWQIAEIFIERTKDRHSNGSIKRDYLTSIKMFIERLGFFETLDSMDIAVAKPINDQRLFKYFCGICWNKIEEKNNGSR